MLAFRRFLYFFWLPLVVVASEGNQAAAPFPAMLGAIAKIHFELLS